MNMLGKVCSRASTWAATTRHPRASARRLPLPAVAAVSAASGALAWACNYPFDTVKTAQAGPPGASRRERRRRRAGALARGAAAFFRGLGPSTTRAVLVTCRASSPRGAGGCVTTRRRRYYREDDRGPRTAGSLAGDSPWRVFPSPSVVLGGRDAAPTLSSSGSGGLYLSLIRPYRSNLPVRAASAPSPRVRAASSPRARPGDHLRRINPTQIPRQRVAQDLQHTPRTPRPRRTATCDAVAPRPCGFAYTQAESFIVAM